MKNVKLKLAALTLASASFFAFNAVNVEPLSIRGTITPIDGATRAWAVSNSDTLKSDIDKGAFEIPNVKPGTYQVIIEAKAPYKNTGKDNVTVADKPADVGEIKLDK